VVAGPVIGTHWHGLLENDGFRREFLCWAAKTAGREGFEPAMGTSFAAARSAQLDLLGDLVAEHLDTEALLTLIEQGAPDGLRVLPPGAPPLD
jgi:adenosylcobyric acid synthase